MTQHHVASASPDESTSSAAPTFASFEEFWPHYVSEHLNPATRWLHFAGTTAAMATVGIAALTRKKSLLLLAAVLGYAPAWAAHFFLEHNHPATFAHPIWSFRADVLMWKKMIDGSMSAEVAAVLKAREEAANATPTTPSTPTGSTTAPAATATAANADPSPAREPAARVRVSAEDEARPAPATSPVVNGVSRAT